MYRPSGGPQRPAFQPGMLQQQVSEGRELHATPSANAAGPCCYAHRCSGGSKSFQKTLYYSSILFNLVPTRLRPRAVQPPPYGAYPGAAPASHWPLPGVAPNPLYPPQQQQFPYGNPHAQLPGQPGTFGAPGPHVGAAAGPTGYGAYPAAGPSWPGGTPAPQPAAAPGAAWPYQGTGYGVR